MATRLRDLPVRLQLFLLSGIMIAGFAVFAVTCFSTIGKIKVNGPLYGRIVSGKDLIADILPPPEYIIESYLDLMQAEDAKDPDVQKGYLEKLKGLRADYESRHKFWERELPAGPLRDALVKTSYGPAVAFYDKAESELIPALLSHDAEKTAAVKGELEKLYEAHRAAIDDVVRLAAKSNDAVEAVARSDIRQGIALLAFIALVTALAAALAAVLTARAITRPLARAVRVSEEIASGNLAVGLEAGGGNETGRLLSAMNAMAGNMRETIQGVKSSASSVAAASEQLSASSAQMSAGLSEQSGRVSRVSSAASEMTRTAADIAKNISAVSETASAASETAGSGSAVVGRSVDEVRAIATTIEGSARVVASLGERSRQIGDIIDVIKEIADQTNLLALNAAIEAARAGDMGRGFAVVADEVRKLAERTTQATSEIGDMIGAIQQEVDQAVSAMGATTGHVAEGVAQVTAAGDTLGLIVEGAGSLKVMVERMAAATEEMSSVSQSIDRDMETIAGVSEETSAGSTQVAQSASDLARLSSDLMKAVGRFRV